MSRLIRYADLIKQQKKVYGFLIDIIDLLKYALENNPEYKTLVETAPFEVWHTKVFCNTAFQIGSKAGIHDLAVRIVWVGNGVIGLCWSLPDRFRPEYLTEKNGELIINLEEVIGLEEPKYFTPAEYPEPEWLKTAHSDSEALLPLSLGNIIGAFRADRKGAVEKLLAGEKIVAPKIVEPKK